MRSFWQVTIAYNKDPSPSKLNLGVGAYRTEVVHFDISILISIIPSILWVDLVFIWDFKDIYKFFRLILQEWKPDADLLLLNLNIHIYITNLNDLIRNTLFCQA